jgi:uncharacterized protein (DUF2062 family)
MRKFLRRYLPGHEAVRDNRWLRPFAGTLLHPELWHLTRRSAAGAVATGLACGLIPGPFQMIGAAIVALVFRVNLPLALFVTLYTNPLTIVPLYLAAFELGRFALGGVDARFVAPPELQWPEILPWLSALADWAAGLGKPLGVGLALLAVALATLGWLTVHIGWRLHLIRAWKARRERRRSDPS